MINLRQRSYQKELMDLPGVPFKAMEDLLKDLNIVNSRLGGHAITLRGLKKFISQKQPVTVCEIGCGGGDNLFAIYKYCSKKNISVNFIGIDISEECIAFAKQRYPQLNCQWICSDYVLVDIQQNPPTIIFSSLFCHHLTDEQLIQMLQWLKKNSSHGFFINDLHRHWLAYYLIKYITRFFSRSYLMKNDACLSVARGFRKEEWKKLLDQSGIINYDIRWQWAFRFLVTCKK
ncbi:MAG: methyltransferase domain-containing protein [Chitinophagaceae bacterium]